MREWALQNKLDLGTFRLEWHSELGAEPGVCENYSLWCQINHTDSL